MNQELFNRDQWNNFVTQNSGSFLQSYEWGLFQESMGRKIWRIAMADGGAKNHDTNMRIDTNGANNTKNTWAATALVVKHELPTRKSYLYCPRGPVVDLRFKTQDLSEIPKTFTREVEKLIKKERAIFLRIDPEWAEQESTRKNLKSIGFRKAANEAQPKKTRSIDLSKSEDELLAAMHPKTRYNIKVAERRRVKVKMNQRLHFEEFWKLLNDTARRDKFRTHPKEYYKKQLEIHSDQFSNELVVTEYEEKITTAAIVNFWNKRATYLHGASDYSSRNLMAPYLLHWEIMKEAKRRGFEEYDFWGIDEEKWPGVTRFKKGFGGREIEYIGAYDVALNPFWYAMYKLSKLFL